MSIALAAALSVLAFIGLVYVIKRAGDRAIEREIAHYRNRRPVYLSCIGRVRRRGHPRQTEDNIVITAATAAHAFKAEQQ